MDGWRVNGNLNDLGLLQEIDEFCIAFEEAWSDGVEPELPEFVGHFSGTAYGPALRELLWIEWDCLRRSGKPPRIDDYLARFPESADVVQEAWQSDQLRIAKGDSTAAPRGNRYRIIKPHARGGLGQVYVANDEHVGRQVALKEIRSGHAHDPVARARLLREARITGRLEHPGIVPVFSVGQNPDGSPYYTMRFVHGDSLREAIGRFYAKYGVGPPAALRASQLGTDTSEPPTSTNDANRSAQVLEPATGRKAKSHLPPEAFRSLEFRHLLARFAFVCHVVEYAHQHGVIHRDIKPSNIMLGKHDETLVVDWGLAKETGEAEAGDRIDPTELLAASSSSGFTTDGATLGTPAYMSPEQAAGNVDAVGPPSDIFSLGATLFHLLTGTSPYVDEGTIAWRQRGKTDTLPRARKWQPSAPLPLDAICAKSLAIQPGDRYDSAESLAGEIENWLADEAVAAYAEPVASRLGRWGRHHRALVRSSMVAIVLLVMSLAATAVLTILHNRELSVAQKDAETKRIAAEGERDVSQAISAFVVDWLRSPDPDLDGHLVTVAETLDRAFANVKSDKRIAPQSRLLLLQTLVDSYAGLGLSDRATEVAEYTIGLSDFETLDVERRLRIRTQLAAARLNGGQFQRALDELVQLTREARQVLGPGHATTLDAEAQLAAAYTAVGRPREGLRTAERAFELSRSALGETHPNTMRLAVEKTRSLNELERFDEAIALAEKVLEWSRSVNGAEHSDTLRAQNHLGLVYRQAGQHDRAIALYKQTLALRLERFGPVHAHTLNTQNLLATAYMNATRYDEAIALHRDTLEKRREHLGANHRDTLRSMFGLGKSYAQAGWTDEAIPLLQETFDAQRQHLGDDDEDTLETQRGLAVAMMNIGRHQEALPLLEQAVKRSSERFGNGFSQVSTAKVELAVAYRQAGRLDEAIAMYRDLMPARTTLLGPEHPEVIRLKINLAAALAAAGQHAEAAASLEELLPLARARLGDEDTTVVGIRLNLAFCFQQLQQPERTVELLEDVEPRVETYLGWQHRWTMGWYLALANAYSSLDRRDEALETYQWLIGELERNMGKDDLRTWAAKRYFAGYLSTSEQYDEAISIMVQAVAVFSEKLGMENAETQAAMMELAKLLLMAEHLHKACFQLGRFAVSCRDAFQRIVSAARSPPRRAARSF